MEQQESDEELDNQCSCHRICVMQPRHCAPTPTRMGLIPGAGHLSQYVISHPGQLSLAIPSWESAMSTSKGQ